MKERAFIDLCEAYNLQHSIFNTRYWIVKETMDEKLSSPLRLGYNYRFDSNSRTEELLD